MFWKNILIGTCNIIRKKVVYFFLFLQRIHVTSCKSLILFINEVKTNPLEMEKPTILENSSFIESVYEN